MAETRQELFGTDGVRAKFGDEPLTPHSLYRLGLASGQVLSKHRQPSRAKAPSRVFVGRDTRFSGPAILRDFGAGLVAGGLTVHDLGVVTTPGVAYSVRNLGAAAGVVISASHNPAEDNGIKLFGPDGFKLPDELEAAIEATFHAAADVARADTPAAIHDASPHVAAYVEHLVANGQRFARRPLEGRRIVLDCAHGAASAIAPRVFTELGAEVTLTAAAPDGHNINDRCGALHPELLKPAVLAANAHAGVTFDGDADRVMLLDETGAVADGDIMLTLLARTLDKSGELAQRTVVSTVMANFGLERALAESGIKLERTPVGDRHVVAAMLRSGHVLGGEQSGHIIHLARGSTTGDGIFNAVTLLCAAFEDGGSLGTHVRAFRRSPQVLLNVKVREKPPFESLPAVSAALSAALKELEGKGRVVLRYSGTEGLARVMVEGEPEALIHEQAGAIASAIKAAIGLPI